MPHRSWLWVTLLGLGLVGFLSGCRSAPPPPPAPSAETPVGPLCQLQGRPDIPATLGEGWSFCVRQQADCNLANASEAVRLRWCVQSTAQICLDTGCKKHRAKECRLGVLAPPGAELQATPPRNTMCGKRWKCTVRAPRPSVFLCKCECPGCPGVPQARHSRAPLLPLAEGAYAVVAVWDEGFCLSGKVRVSKFEGGAFTLTTAGKCLPAGLKLRAVFARSGGAFFAVGEDPGGGGRFHLTGVVEDPDAFTGVLTRSTSLEERPQDRLRLTGRRMITTK